jgi:hypothetical protein
MDTRREIRRLRFDVIDGHRKTGRLLTLVPPTKFSGVLAQYGITISHALVCMDLHRLWHECNWAYYEPINTWWRDAGQRSPRTPIEAITMLQQWRAMRH